MRRVHQRISPIVSLWEPRAFWLQSYPEVPPTQKHVQSQTVLILENEVPVSHVTIVWHLLANPACLPRSRYLSAKVKIIWAIIVLVECRFNDHRGRF